MWCGRAGDRGNNRTDGTIYLEPTSVVTYDEALRPDRLMAGHEDGENQANEPRIPLWARFNVGTPDGASERRRADGLTTEGQ